MYSHFECFTAPQNYWQSEYFLLFGAMGMVFIQKGGGIFAKLTIRSAADRLVQSPLPQAPTVQQLQALLKDL
ncbi:unnamed protein product [Sphagnum jensenii]|uniref:Uncharacterized protein n=1 Tax=Sphagnum jensenii TaxID=128206 RepID=A0ABP1AIH3_9BRYO